MIVGIQGKKEEEEYTFLPLHFQRKHQSHK